MSEMVERISQRLYDAFPRVIVDRKEAVDLVRAVIAAMRDVTKEMAEAGAVELDNCTDSSWGSTPDGGREDYTTINSDAPCLIWRAMIDASLRNDDREGGFAAADAERVA